MKYKEEDIIEHHMSMRRERAIVCEQRRMAAGLLREAEILEGQMHAASLKLQDQLEQRNRRLSQEVGMLQERNHLLEMKLEGPKLSSQPRSQQYSTWLSRNSSPMTGQSGHHPQRVN